MTTASVTRGVDPVLEDASFDTPHSSGGSIIRTFICSGSATPRSPRVNERHRTVPIGTQGRKFYA